ncbi:hypothetical protein BVX98_05815 [bacterium F11]|nr:hypothetical protein BVX98_05815 [bacterium F11]
MKCVFFMIPFVLVANLAWTKGKDFREVVFEYEKGHKLTLQSTEFVAAEHKLKRCGKESICLIDGKPFFGSDGDVPRRELVSMKVEIQDKPIELDVTGMFNPWNVYKNEDYVSKDQYRIEHIWENTWVLRGSFSDGAGYYSAEWMISEGGSIRTILKSLEGLSHSCDAMD